MRTKHLNQLIADVEVAKINFAKQAAEAFGKNEEADKQALLAVAQMDNLQGHLQQSVQIRNRSFLLDHAHCEAIIKSLNKKGFSFTLPKCEGILHLKMQIANIEFPGNKEFAAEFVLRMLQTELSNQELAAVQACLDLIENQIEV